MCSQGKRETALKVFYQTNSISETVRMLGYPTKKQLYNWIAVENMLQKNVNPCHVSQILLNIREIHRWKLNLMQLNVALNMVKV